MNKVVQSAVRLMIEIPWVILQFIVFTIVSTELVIKVFSLPLNKHVCINSTMVRVSVAKGPLLCTHIGFLRVFYFIIGITCTAYYNMHFENQ